MVMASPGCTVNCGNGVIPTIPAQLARSTDWPPLEAVRPVKQLDTPVVDGSEHEQLSEASASQNNVPAAVVRDIVISSLRSRRSMLT
jgi:hypothetical protein